VKILIAEDDAPLASFVVKAFKHEGQDAEAAADGQKALQRLKAGSFDMLILDLNLPVTSGHEVLKTLRNMNSDLPVLILSGTSQVEERVACLDAGADDYLTKPFSFSELSARVRALSRRKSKVPEAVLKAADLEFDRVRRKVKRGGRLIELTPKEFSLLEYFMTNPGRCITRRMIIEDVWSMSGDTVTNVVDVYVNYLRKKIDEGATPKLIHTIRGIGYQFGPEGETARTKAVV
jgi:DNA-binding response OmpR family regulator